MDAPDIVKTCTKCGEVKAIELFQKRKAGKDGFHTQCKKCVSIRYKAYREANKEALKTYIKAYREANKEALKTCNKAYREANKEAIKTYDKVRREENTEKANISGKLWRKAHPERCRKYGKIKVIKLTDAYIRLRLGMTKEQATPELIELKRTQLQLIRLTREFKNERSKITDSTS
jgi:hypothetical protein